MKKILSKVILILLVVSSFCLPLKETLALSADKDTSVTTLEDNTSDVTDNLDYVIENYDVKIIVNENNTFDITETITAYFNKPRHGIYRKIPLSNTVTRLNGKVTKNRAQVTNVSVDNKYTTSRAYGFYTLKIGSESENLTGRQTYVIKYTYNIGKDPLKNADELYLNIIGTDWDTKIKKVTFSIKMPKAFDYNKLGFAIGEKGSVQSGMLSYKVEDNLITGEYNDVLNAHEALTVRCELEDNYFVNAGLKYTIVDYLAIIIPVIGAVISLLLWYAFGKDDKVIETVEFFPPKGCNSLDVGFLYKGKADSKDVTSLLIYLANKGYLKIVELDKNVSHFKYKDFKIIKIKDYDGDDENERTFMEGLFKNKKNKEETLNEVTPSDLYDSFYKTTNKIMSNVNKADNKNKIFTKKSRNKKIFPVIMIILTYLIITIPPLYACGDLHMVILALSFPALGFTFMFGVLLDSSISSKAGAITAKIFAVIWGVLFAGVPWAVFVLPNLLQDPLFFIAYIVGIICVALMMVTYKFMPKRTAFGNEMLGKLSGFKNFLETAEKEKLEALVNENPTYFYDILPFTYVLDVSDKWIKNFETISMQAPTWYNSSSTFDLVYFNTFISSTMTRANAAMSSSPHSSGSSGSSGGGISGGGSGGGGGGSW